jgi:hypothetical protein
MWDAGNEPAGVKYYGEKKDIKESLNQNVRAGNCESRHQTWGKKSKDRSAPESCDRSLGAMEVLLWMHRLPVQLDVSPIYAVAGSDA